MSTKRHTIGQTPQHLLNKQVNPHVIHQLLGPGQPQGIQTNPPAVGRTSGNNTTNPVVNQVITAIAPNLDNIPTYDENNRDGWNSCIRKWEILMTPYRFDKEHLAMALPGKPTGQSYMKVIEMNPNCAKDFPALKAELAKRFKPDNPMQERKL